MMMHESLKDLPDLWSDVKNVVRQVPVGRVTTYGKVAEALGDVRASKFVWLVMSSSREDEAVPWHRVVRSDGRVAGVRESEAMLRKTALLEGEDISVSDGEVSDFRTIVFDDFEFPMCLKRLRARQMTLKESLRIPRSDIRLSRIAAADVSYDGDKAFASVIILDYETGEVVAEHTCTSEAGFPYIPSYLSFRELPVISPLARQLEDGTVLMYDGNGILHPEGFGIASHAGVVFDIPTIGVAKKLLCGTLSGGEDAAVSKVLMRGDVVGYAVSEDNRKPVYVSPGHGISRSQSLCIVRRFLRSRIPEPLQLAHRAANTLRRSAPP